MIQQHIAKSRLSIPVMTLYGIAVWTVLLLSDLSLWPAAILFTISLLLLTELNNRNALNRQHNRKVCCIYIATMAMCPDILANIHAMAVQTCLLAALMQLFQTYQRRDDMTHRYAAYLFFGIGITLWPPLLFFLPIFWFGEAVFLMSFSLRAWGASLLGLLTPLWFALPLLIYFSRFDLLFQKVNEILPDETTIHTLSTAFQNIQAPAMPPIRLAATALIIIIFVVSTVYYLRHSYNDKIQVRMLHHFLIVLAAAAAIALIATILLPLNTTAATACLTGIIIATAAPSATQYITLTTSRAAGVIIVIFFLLSILLAWI